MESLKVYLNDVQVARLTMEREIDRMARRIMKQAPVVAAKLAKRFPSACYDRIVAGINERVKQLWT